MDLPLRAQDTHLSKACSRVSIACDAERVQSSANNQRLGWHVRLNRTMTFSSLTFSDNSDTNGKPQTHNHCGSHVAFKTLDTRCNRDAQLLLFLSHFNYLVQSQWGDQTDRLPAVSSSEWGRSSHRSTPWPWRRCPSTPAEPHELAEVLG